MYEIAKLKKDDRNVLFSDYAEKNNINIAIVEKDFWVTLMLDYLFHRSSYKDCFIFKGGTSLSKCFNIINRFSEDIDLILNWNALTEENPNNERTTNQQNRYNEKINKLAVTFIKDKLLQEMIFDFKTILNETPNISISEDEPQVIRFSYPRFDESNETGILEYIRLEIGALSALSPNEEVEISPLIAKSDIISMKQKSTKIKTILPERTFWEKILILNQEAHRSDEKNVPSRYSRHYYDVYKISLTKYKNIAYANLNLLSQVREFKKKFYPSSWASYDSAKPGSFLLVPSDKHKNELRKDFLLMKEMINDEAISNFDELLKNIREIESEINNLK